MNFEEFWESYQSGKSYHDDSELMDLLKTVARHSWEARAENALVLPASDAALIYSYVTFALEVMESSGIDKSMRARARMDTNSLIVRLSNYIEDLENDI